MTDTMQFFYIVGSVCGKWIKMGWSKSHNDLLNRLHSHAKDGLRGILFPKLICYTHIRNRSTEDDIKKDLKQYVMEGESEIFSAEHEQVLG